MTQNSSATLLAGTSGTYRAIGTTDDCTTCDKCGKTHLKNTIILAVLDSDGNTEDVVYYGSTCAGRATGVRKAALDRAIGAANRERRTNLELLNHWTAYYEDGEAGVDRYITNNAGHLGHSTRKQIALMIAQTVVELEERVAIPRRR